LAMVIGMLPTKLFCSRSNNSNLLQLIIMDVRKSQSLGCKAWN
jgi:hypothetical protein